MKQTEQENKNDEKKIIIDLYINRPKILTRGKIKQSTLDKILEDINAHHNKKRGNWKPCK